MQVAAVRRRPARAPPRRSARRPGGAVAVFGRAHARATGHGLTNGETTTSWAHQGSDQTTPTPVGQRNENHPSRLGRPAFHLLSWTASARVLATTNVNFKFAKKAQVISKVS